MTITGGQAANRRGDRQRRPADAGARPDPEQLRDGLQRDVTDSAAACLRSGAGGHDLGQRDRSATRRAAKEAESSPAAPTRFPRPVISIFANTVVGASPGSPRWAAACGWIGRRGVGEHDHRQPDLRQQRQPGRRGRRVLRRQPLGAGRGHRGQVNGGQSVPPPTADRSISRARFSTAGAVNSSLTLATTCCRTPPASAGGSTRVAQDFAVGPLADNGGPTADDGDSGFESGV